MKLGLELRDGRASGRSKVKRAAATYSRSWRAVFAIKGSLPSKVLSPGSNKTWVIKPPWVAKENGSNGLVIVPLFNVWIL